MDYKRKWNARWINGNSNFYLSEVPPAPYLRTVFEVKGICSDARIFLAAPGWHVLYLNGHQVGDHVLSPVVTEFDKHVSYVEYDIASFLHPGRNAIAVLLGNGWYNCHTHEVWQFDNAPWRDAPKLLCEIEIDRNVTVRSGKDWKTTPSPVIFDGLRNGETYDSRLEIPGFSEAEFDDSAWSPVALCNPPGGEMIREELEPCKIMKRYIPVKRTVLSSEITVYDFGTNLTGWCEVEVEGLAGAEVQLEYSEKKRENGDIERGEIEKFVKSGNFQCDRFILNGKPGRQKFSAHFTYHGFRYVRLTCEHPQLQIHEIKACFIHNSFTQVGKFVSSDPTLNRLQEITVQTYLSNFTGIPTDCSHREKNGWTGDAQVALETGLWNFDGRHAYKHFLRILTDTQRVNGQLPGIVPTGGWGFNWGSGPAWDSMLFEAVEKIWLFYADDAPMIEYYKAMSLYIDYCRWHSDDEGLVNFGLGDWCHFDRNKITPVEVTSSGYVYSDILRMSKFSDHLGFTKDAAQYATQAAHIYDSFNRRFRKSDGDYADGAVTALGTALYFGLCSGTDAQKTVELLVERVRKNKHRADFGILGAKFIPRVLADYGYAEDACQILIQKAFPGWGFWLEQGATTLWEQWGGCSSQNHIMFGDVSAWMFRYLGGIAPNEAMPGFEHFTIKPCFVSMLDKTETQYDSIRGRIRSSWKRTKGRILCEFEIPANTTAQIILPGKILKRTAGIYQEEV